VYNLANMSSIAAALNSFERDCTITIALKISDNSCKMDDYEKSVFISLYDSLATKETDFFESSVHDIIYLGRNNPSAQTYKQIKKLRESAMDMITRPKMKAFKASIRERLI